MCAFLSSSYFNSHPHEEDDGTTINRPVVSSYFNSHPHEEDDRPTMISCSCPTNFNSHPHEEDDTYTPPVAGSTDISTHILTKRMTVSSIYGWYESLFQLTSSRRGWRYLLGMFVIVFVFQLTSSRRGWRSKWCEIWWKHISTHILTKRMTAILNKNNLFKIAYYISNKHFISIVDIFFHFHIYF